MNVALWCAVTIAVYVLAERVARALRNHPAAHPVMTSTLALIGILVVMRVPYDAYARATHAIAFLLIPATAALAVPLYRELHAIRKNALAVGAAICAGSATIVVSAIAFARAFGCDEDIVRSIATKAVTTPVAMAVSAQIGGLPELAAVISIVTGVIGALFAAVTLRYAPKRIAGLAIGTAAHGVGTAQLYRLSRTASAYAGLAMGLNAVLTAVVLPLLARVLLPLAIVALVALPLRAAAAGPIVLVPLDDRPVTLQLPLMLGEIAGRRVVAPPRALLGTYLHFGRPDAIAAWLNSSAPRDADALVASTDMLAYGGLVASRVPGVRYDDAYFRLREIAAFKRLHPRAWIGAFGTVMRLAPTGVPAIEDATTFFAAYPAWTYLQQYANLHDPPLPGEEAAAERLRAQMGDALLQSYLDTRARNYAVDALLIDDARRGVIDRLVLGQDDAGRVGLHVKDVRALERSSSDLGERVSIQPGADELGMTLVANALARAQHWTPHVAVRYSTPEGAAYQDPLEFAPIGETIDRLISLAGAVRDDERPDLTLYVRVPRTPASLDDALVASMASDADARHSIAFADLSFEAGYAAQGAFAQRILASGLGARIDAYASWNTTANTVGTALAEAIAAGAGRRAGTYDALAHRTFTFMRFVDDYAYHVDVRPALNTWLDAQGVADHTYLPSSIAPAAESRSSALLWPFAQAILTQLDPGLHIAAMRLTLPWRRTFETQVDVRLAPRL